MYVYILYICIHMCMYVSEYTFFIYLYGCLYVIVYKHIFAYFVLSFYYYVKLYGLLLYEMVYTNNFLIEPNVFLCKIEIIQFLKCKNIMLLLYQQVYLKKTT